MSVDYKFFAFISYSSKDTIWGKRLQKKLENYRMPAKLCKEHGWNRKPMNPIFFAPTDIQPGVLTEEIQARLKDSHYLIVICSPNSAQSEWVGLEIAFFHSLGRAKDIHFFIVKGTPHSGNKDTECFHPIVKKLELPEILGANIHEKVYRLSCLNKERAYIQLISKLLNVEFDSIWHRHRRLMVRNVTLWAVGAIVVIATILGVWEANQSFDTEIRLKETSIHNDKLPLLNNANVTMFLDNETKSGIINSLDSCCTFSNIPHRFLGKAVRFVVISQDYYELDTTVILGRMTTLGIRRNPEVYGKVHFVLWDPSREVPVSNETVYVDGIKTTSGVNGRVELFIPLEKQKRVYGISASVPLTVDSINMPPLGENQNIWIMN